ncbi:MAG TPA: dihydroneopterin aldolase [Alphaproteobacteria bacterium]|nr:dihydroneopterin aldolase [Alphaproteobacteria bacterium]
MSTAEWMLADALGMERRVAEAKPSLYRICVRDLVLQCPIGVHDYEKQAPQRVRINAELLVEGRVGRDEFRQVLNYETIVDGIRALAQGRHTNLVETLADRILDLCFADPRVRETEVRVEKLDVYPEAESIGIVMKRRRNSAAASGEE